MKTAVVIVTYNRLNLLRECMEAVLASGLPFSYVVVVDNASTDGTGYYLKEELPGKIREGSHAAGDFGHSENVVITTNENETIGTKSAPQYTVLTQDHNLGGAGGFEAGVRYVVEHCSDTDYLLLIDDDAMISSDYMERLISFHEREPEVLAMAGRVETEGVTDPSHRRKIRNKLLFLEMNASDKDYKKKGFYCDLATFCGLVITKEGLKEAGVPRGDFFLWYDDTEYCLRLIEAQHRRDRFGKRGIAVINSAVLNHKTKPKQENGNLVERPDQRYYYGYRNRILTAREHFGRPGGFCVILEHVLIGLYGVTLIKKNSAQFRFNVKMIWHSTLDALRGRTGKRQGYL